MEKIRLAQVTDSPAIAQIYRPYVEESSISFEAISPSADEISLRMQQILLRFPWLVIERDGLILGYAYASEFKARTAYGWSVETSIYLREGYVGQGLGKTLYQRLLETLRAQGIVNALGCITIPNEPSVALHERLGFQKVSHFKELGFKFGRWWDVGYWQLQLQELQEPKALRGFEFSSE